ncbi:MAG TPA: hypothetical protein VFJ74_13070 [Gemmatimonadaceae bacterium]|nr:hypothetical protein [Gemmatimonadaceae bacterium]
MTGTITRDGTMPSTFTAPTAGVVMRGRNARSTNTVQGWAAVALGVPFVGIGLAIVALIAGTFGAAAGGRLAAPAAVMATLSATFTLVGLAFVGSGVRAIVRRAGAPTLRARFPGQPWMWDFPWDRRGGRDESVGEIGRALVVAAMIELFLVPFHWVGFQSAERLRMFQLITLIFDAVVAAIVGYALYLTARRVRYGRSRIRFAGFPCAPGEEATLDLAGISPLARRYPLVATLRCIEERYEMHGNGRHRRAVTVCYELGRDVRTVAPGETTVRFPIPADAPTTTLGARPPRYWELELAAEVPGVDFGARFLVPVY